MRVLIVEAGERTTNLLVLACANAGFTLDRPRDVWCALSLARANEYDLMIADEVMGGIDGQGLVRHLRSIGNGTPAILFADSELALGQALAAGADDVLLRSATPAEVLHRVQALLRTFWRRPRSTPTRLLAADLELDAVKRTSFRARRPIDLTNGEFSTLELLMHRRDEVVSRTLIASSSLPNFKRCPDAVDVHMSRLRRKVDGHAPRKLLHSVRGAGYVLEDRG
jgi:two-component system copper resistance phosphate regulon response regulator CusR